MNKNHNSEFNETKLKNNNKTEISDEEFDNIFDNFKKEIENKHLQNF